MTDVPEGNWRFHAGYDFITDGTSVVIRKGDSIVRLIFEPRDRNQPNKTPTVSDLGRDMQDGQNSFLRAALNCAWDLGLRPDGFEDARESMRATNKHLEDMRAIAFHSVKVEKP